MSSQSRMSPTSSSSGRESFPALITLLDHVPSMLRRNASHSSSEVMVLYPGMSSQTSADCNCHRASRIGRGLAAMLSTAVKSAVVTVDRSIRTPNSIPEFGRMAFNPGAPPSCPLEAMAPEGVRPGVRGAWERVLSQRAQPQRMRGLSKRERVLSPWAGRWGRTGVEEGTRRASWSSFSKSQQSKKKLDCCETCAKSC